jgi:hypothetical protein
VAAATDVADAGTSGHRLLDHVAILGSLVKATVDASPVDVATAMRSAIAAALAPPRGACRPAGLVLAFTVPA